MVRFSTFEPTVQLCFKDKANFYHELSQMVRSGISFPVAIGHFAVGQDSVARVARKITERIKEGVAPAMAAAGFPSLEVEILSAAEQSGRLDVACEKLEEYFSEMSACRRKVIASCLYPVGLFHLAAALLLIPVAIANQDFFGYFKMLGLVLLVGYLIVGLMVGSVLLMRWAVKKFVIADRFLCRVPLVGSLFRLGGLWRFCLVFSLGIRSADGVLASIVRAGRASQHAATALAVGSAVSSIRNGARLAEALRNSGGFPDDFLRSIQTAESSGRLEESAIRLAETYQAQFFELIRGIGEWVPRLFTLVVVLGVGGVIAVSAIRYYSMVFSLLGQ